MSERKLVLIAAGGTGGHVFPALAVAAALREKHIDVLWLGTRQGMEARVAPAHDIPMHFIRVVGLRGKNLWYWLKAPVLMFMAVINVLWLVLRVKPACVLGLGGFVSAAGGIAAYVCRVPLFLQEQNAVPGTTNRMLAPLAKTIFTGFPGAFASRSNRLYTGNPLRAEFSGQGSASEESEENQQTELKVLVLGGSLGASIMNEVLPPALQQFAEKNSTVESLQIWHQTGVADLPAVQNDYSNRGQAARVEAFIDDMPEAYRWADIVVARSGALTVSEIAAMGVASILVPYPHAIDDHQSANAQWLVDADAAIKIDQNGFNTNSLVDALQKLTGVEKNYLWMATRLRSIAKLEATKRISSACEAYCR